MKQVSFFALLINDIYLAMDPVGTSGEYLRS